MRQLIKIGIYLIIAVYSSKAQPAEILPPVISIAHNKNMFSDNSSGQLMMSNKELNTEQAELMISLFQSVQNGDDISIKIESIINAIGTELIIDQMNLMRKVSKVQYRAVLSALPGGKFPGINPVDSSLKAKKGVRALEECWKHLRWSLYHIDLLKDEISAIKSFNVYKRSEELALSYLPDSTLIDVSMFVVIGGRSGAAALKGNAIYYDLGKMSHLHVQNGEDITPLSMESELVDFFAHEMHHIGLQQVREGQGNFSGYRFQDQQVLKFLNGIISEGSASYLVSGHRDILKTGFAKEVKNPDSLFQRYEDAIHLIFNGSPNNNEFEKTEALFTGNLQHIAGTALLYAIDQVYGLDKVMECIYDPRKLLFEYNNAAIELNKDGKDTYIFDEKLVKTIFDLSQEEILLDDYFRSLKSVKVEIENKTYDFLFDTGGGITMVSPKIIEAIHKTAYGNFVGFRMSGEKVESKLCDSVEIKIGGINFFHAQVSVFDMMSLLPKELKQIDGLISLKTFEHSQISLNLSDNKLIMETNRSLKEKTKKMDLVPSLFANGQSGKELTILLGTQARNHVWWFLFDTGNIGPVKISTSSAKDWELLNNANENGEIGAYTFELAGDSISAPAIIDQIIHDGAFSFDFIQQSEYTISFTDKKVWKTVHTINKQHDK